MQKCHPVIDISINILWYPTLNSASIGILITQKCNFINQPTFNRKNNNFLLQQETVLAELTEYACTNPADTTVPATPKYLEACHLIFERDILNPDIIVCGNQTDG